MVQSSRVEQKHKTIRMCYASAWRAFIVFREMFGIYTTTKNSARSVILRVDSELTSVNFLRLQNPVDFQALNLKQARFYVF